MPTSYNDFRLIHLDGKHSILRNIPHPRGDVVGDHGYFSVSSILEVVLGLGYEIDYLPNINKYSEYYKNSTNKTRLMHHLSVVKGFAKKQESCTNKKR